MKTVIQHAKSIKEAKEIVSKDFGSNWGFIGVYRYGTKGNHFYEFIIN